MGGCDFSPRPYTYVDTPGDVDLNTFTLQEEDLDYKVRLKPLILSWHSLLNVFDSPDPIDQESSEWDWQAFEALW